MGDIKAAYERHASRKFPESPNDSALDDLHAELAELDGHVAGLANSRMRGKPIKIDMALTFSPIDGLLEKAGRSLPDSDYLKSVREHVFALKSLARVVNEP